MDIVNQFGPLIVLDVGCGTGTFACLLSHRGPVVTGVDPALASLEIARREPGGDRVTMIHVTAADLPPLSSTWPR